MTRTRLLTTIALALMLTLLVSGAAAEDFDRKAVEAAVLDYVEGVYLNQPERIARSVHPELAKYGFWRRSDAEPYAGSAMNFEQLQKLAAEWNRSKKIDVSKAPKQIDILDLADQTASVKLTAEWGIDYMHLAKFDGKWMIRNVMWQKHPPKRQ